MNTNAPNNGYWYTPEVENDIANALWTYNLDEWRGRRDELEEQLNQDLRDDDSVTGNASGYWVDIHGARSAVCANLDLLYAALTDAGIDAAKRDRLLADAECDRLDLAGYNRLDTIIRRYLLEVAIPRVLDDFGF